jgi:dipeptidyl-peptidase-4
LFGALFIPRTTLYGEGPWPTVVSVYGGPHVQRVKADWALANEVRAQALRRDGFLVLVLDNRGSARRGLAFEACLHRRMGTVEVEDQAAAVRTLIASGLTDPARVGIYGWSYGGYMSLHCLAQHPHLFTAAVSGAPVTFWQGYDTGYTERYMGTPADNAAGYAAASVLTHASRITGRLLLVHGLLDENVHARHSWELVSSLISAGVPHETLFVPGERHVVRAPRAKALVDARVRDHFRRYIGADVAAHTPLTRIPLPDSV